MSDSFGKHLRLTLFGESHGPAIGVVVDGLPAGLPLDLDAVRRQMLRRAPGMDSTATARREPDEPRILSGLYRGRTTGTALASIIENTNTRSQDYRTLEHLARPGHADYAGSVRYGGFADPRGGGHFSGRLTAPLVFAGALARQLLAAEGIEIGAHIQMISDVSDRSFDADSLTSDRLRALGEMRLPLLDPCAEGPMRAAIATAKQAGDSVGGIIECAAIHVPAGIGSPFFDSVESAFAHLAFSIPAVKAVSFGDGMAIASLRGSEANDAMRMQNGRVVCESNHNGGVTGGITNGMPILARVAIKPTPSIALRQNTVDVSALQDAELSIVGRHDPCIVPRAVPVVEAALALALADLWLDARTPRAR